jgi:hypothetical protein
MMRKRCLTASLSCRLGLLLFVGYTLQPLEAAASAPPLQQGMARLWVLRQSGAPIAAADPMVYANGAPLTQSALGTAFFHDFQPGTYNLTVQPFGTPANLVDTIQLAAGTEAYVQVQVVPNWEMGATTGGAAFAVLTMSPELAQAYLPTMTYLGPR